jgi:hypothetical protein
MALSEPWILLPYVGVGPLRFGMTFDDVEACIGEGELSKKSPMSDTLVDAHNALGLHAYYSDDDGGLEFVEVFVPFRLAIDGHEVMFEQDDRNLRLLIEELGYEVIVRDVGLKSRDLGILSYSPLGTVEGVSIASRAYFENLK